MPWITEAKKRKCPHCGQMRDTWYQAPKAEKPEPWCQVCIRERDKARREARKAAKTTESTDEPVDAEAKPKRSRRPKKDGQASGTAKAIAANRVPVGESA